jgi:hypothetical protein
VKSFAKYMTGFNGVLLSLSILLPMASAATTYTYTNGTTAGEPGFTLYDDTGTPKLLDLSTGTASVLDGTWVGWANDTPSGPEITFTFDTSVTITSVALNFLREDNGDVHLPSSVTIDGTNFLTTDFAVDNTEGYVSYAGTFTGSTLVVTLNPAASAWVFVNEAQFTADSSTPEPASLMLVGLGMGGLILGQRHYRRRRLATPIV